MIFYFSSWFCASVLGCYLARQALFWWHFAFLLGYSQWVELLGPVVSTQPPSWVLCLEMIPNHVSPACGPLSLFSWQLVSQSGYIHISKGKLWGPRNVQTFVHIIFANIPMANVSHKASLDQGLEKEVGLPHVWKDLQRIRSCILLSVISALFWWLSFLSHFEFCLIFSCVHCSEGSKACIESLMNNYKAESL